MTIFRFKHIHIKHVVNIAATFVRLLRRRLQSSIIVVMVGYNVGTYMFVFEVIEKTHVVVQYGIITNGWSGLLLGSVLVLHRSQHPVELVEQATCIAQEISIVGPSPKWGGAGLTVVTLERFLGTSFRFFDGRLERIDVRRENVAVVVTRGHIMVGGRHIGVGRLGHRAGKKRRRLRCKRVGIGVRRAEPRVLDRHRLFAAWLAVYLLADAADMGDVIKLVKIGIVEELKG